MEVKRQGWKTRLRALVALVVMLAGWFSAPVALASSPLNFCSMLCCVEDGYCCCLPRRLLVAGQFGDSKECMDGVELRCTEDCDLDAAFASRLMSELLREDCGPELNNSDSFVSWASFPLPVGFEFNNSSPRSPPLL